MKTRLLKNGLQLFSLLLTMLITITTTAQTVQTFNSSGSWICPAGVTSVFVESWGAGGAGGGIAALTAGGAGGGGGGGYSKSVISVTPGTTYNYVVGTGGVGGLGVGQAGGLTSFNSVVIAQGGTGGGSGPSGAAGVGGVGYDYNGGNGAAGVSGTRSGAGGGGAGSSSIGGNATTTTAGTGGTGGGGAGGAGRTTAAAIGLAGSTLGGGGGGAYSTGLGGVGGNGANGQISLTYCSSKTTITATVTGASFNWATASSWDLNRVPTLCDNVVINVNRAATSNETVTLTIPSFSVQSLTIRNLSTSIYQVLVAASVSSGATVNIYGDLTVETVGGVSSGNRNNRTAFGGNNVTYNIYGNMTLGRPSALASIAREGHSTVSGDPSTWNLYGNLTFNPRGYNTNRGTVYNFNSGGTQYMINNTNPTVYNDTIKGNRFQTLNIGNTNPTTVILSGTNDDFTISSLIAGDLNVGVNSTLDMPENYSFNMASTAATISNFRLAAGARLRLGGDQSLVTADGSNLGVAGSNFPGGYDFYTLNPTSTVEYYGSNAITQTIFNGATYGNLLALNGSGSGRAVKQTTAGTLSVATSFNINALTDVYLNTATGLGTNTAPVTCNGPLNIAATGGLYCNANVVSGTGAFTMGAGSFLGMGHPQGISNSGSATGNIQMTGGRSYNATGNYIYNGTVAQVTGAGLPSVAINDLTIDNPTTVTIATNQLVNGVALLKQGVFDIGSTKIVHNGTGTLNSTGGKMKANLGIVEMKGTSGTAQNISGSWFVNKNISSLINSNTTGVTVAASPADTLLISSALLYGITNSVINTNSNLTLLSRDTATARFGPLGTGNDITGQVTIERYLPAKKSWRLLAAPVANGTSPFVSASWREGGSMASTGYGTRITGPASFVGVDEYTQRASMKYYNGVLNNYVDVTNTNTTKIGNTNTGYYVFVRGDRSVTVAGAAAPTILRIKGDIQKGAQTIAVPAGKFVTVGNPYPSAIDFKTVSKTNISNTFYVWNPNAGGSYNVGAFENYTFSSGEYRKVPGGTVRNAIQSGEAVFIQSNGAAGSITVNETDKTGGVSTPVSRTSTSVERNGLTAPTLEVNMFTKDVDGSTYLADGVLMNFDNNYNAGLDNDDVRKISNVGDNFAIKNDANLLIVERRPFPSITDTIKFSLTNVRVNSYHFEIDPSLLQGITLSPILKDKFLGTETPISVIDVTNYNFDITADAASRVADRFMIVFKQVSPMRFTKITAVRNADKTATVTWYTENENNINEYKIEHSTDGINFTEIGRQMPTANNNGNPYYSFVHAATTDGVNFYRVEAIAIRGAAQISNKASINAMEKTGIPALSVYPNPVIDGKVNIHFANQLPGAYQINIFNKMGQLITTEKISVATNKLLKTINIPTATKGIYQLKITDDNGKATTISFFVN